MPSWEAARKGASAASRHGRRSFRVVHPRPFLALDLLDLLFELLHEAVVRGYAIDVLQERADRIIDIADFALRGSAIRSPFIAAKARGFFFGQADGDERSMLVVVRLHDLPRLVQARDGCILRKGDVKRKLDLARAEE